jgi:L-2,4-diaminobutyric acid acetyltransferase
MAFQFRDPSSKKFLHALVRRPRCADAERIAVLARSLPREEHEAAYLYLLLSEHFATTSVLAEMEGYVVGFATGYRKPTCHDTLFVWQVGTAPPVQGKGIGTAMLLELLGYPENEDVRFVEVAAAPNDRAMRRLFARMAQALQAPLDDIPAIAPTHFVATRAGGSLLRLGPIACRSC